MPGSPAGRCRGRPPAPAGRSGDHQAAHLPQNARLGGRHDPKSAKISAIPAAGWSRSPPRGFGAGAVVAGKADHHGFCRYGLAAVRVVRNGPGSLIDMGRYATTGQQGCLRRWCWRPPVVTGATAGADPAAPAGAHQVRYALVRRDGELRLYYLVAQPPSKAAYDADACSYLKKESVTVGPDQPWVFETSLADPSWAHPDREQHHARWPGRPQSALRDRRRRPGRRSAGRAVQPAVPAQAGGEDRLTVSGAIPERIVRSPCRFRAGGLPE